MNPFEGYKPDWLSGMGMTLPATKHKPARLTLGWIDQKHGIVWVESQKEWKQ